MWLQCKVCSLDMNESHGHHRLHEECADKWFVYCKSTCWKAYKH
jgi:hypothetical protein